MTLQEIMRERIAFDARAHIGSIDEQYGQVRISFGAYGALPALVIGIVGDHVRVISPSPGGAEIAVDDDPKTFPEKVVVADHSRDELIAIAVERGVDIKTNDTKSEIAEALNKAAGYDA